LNLNLLRDLLTSFCPPCFWILKTIHPECIFIILPNFHFSACSQGFLLYTYPLSYPCLAHTPHVTTTFIPSFKVHNLRGRARRATFFNGFSNFFRPGNKIFQRLVNVSATVKTCFKRHEKNPQCRTEKCHRP